MIVAWIKKSVSNTPRLLIIKKENVNVLIRTKDKATL